MNKGHISLSPLKKAFYKKVKWRGASAGGEWSVTS